jgi:hypothetical protein
VHCHVVDGGDSFQVLRIAANTLNKKSVMDSQQEWSYCFGVEQCTNNSLPEISILLNITFFG